MGSTIAYMVASSLVVGCGQTSGEGTTTTSGGAPEPSATAEPVAPLDYATETKKLDAIGLSATVPEGAKLSPPIGGGKGVMILGPAPVNLMVVGEGAAKTLETAKKEAAIFKPENMGEEKLADGWLLTFESTSETSKNYWVEGLRKIGDATITCTSTASTAQQRAGAIAVCKSLKTP